MPATLTPSKTPRYQELVEQFSGRIRSGELLPGTRLPSFTEMREQQGVSQTTIVKVFAHLEREGLIRREPKRGIFVASQEKQATGQIGYVGSAYAQRRQNPYAAHIVQGMETVIRREDLRTLLLHEEAKITPDKVDGVLSSASLFDAGACQAQGIPVVAVFYSAEGIPSVISDDHGGARLGIGRLIELGHRRIAALLQSSAPVIHLRTAGYQSALLEAGITPDANWLRDPGYMTHPGGYRPWGYESMKAWLAEDWRDLDCTALFVQNDLAAMGVLDALREAEIRVPEDLSILSFDGTEVCEYSWPSLAAVEVPLEQIGATGMELLLRMIRGERVEPTITMLPARWKDGDSVAPPREYSARRGKGRVSMLSKSLA